MSASSDADGAPPLTDRVQVPDGARLVLATHNAGKLAELRQILEPLVPGLDPGSIISALPGDALLGELLEDYAKLHFVRQDGSLNTKTIVAYTTEMLRRHGFTGGNRMQQVGNFVLYPSEYFCPFEHETQMVVKTENTRSIHHFSATWSPWWRKARFRAIGLAARLLGRERYLALKHCIKK